MHFFSHFDSFSSAEASESRQNTRLKKQLKLTQELEVISNKHRKKSAV